jgi:4-amino-4-deoxy-L-arabinose transferase-like glycosyltransferase
MNKDRLWFGGLLCAAVILYTFNLGELPLRDWDEGIVAGVARNIWRADPGTNVWLYPTINNDQPYWNKPPLVHWLIAITYRYFGVSEWSTRLVPALISAFSVPLLYKIGREIFTIRLAAIFSALVYLTLLPIARHGRLAMLDGVIACWFSLTIWCLLRGRYRSQFLLGVGCGIGLVGLTKGVMMSVLLGGIVVIFLLWNAPKLLLSGYFWGGLVLGGIPALAWYSLQYLHYGAEFLGVSLGEQTFNRVWQPVSDRFNPPWYYLIEIAKYTLPWLLFLPGGIKLALRDRNLSWAKLTLVWSGVYLLAISVMVTKLPWYIIPLYPALSLLIGVNLADAWQQRRQAYPYSWKIALSLIAVISWGGSIYYGLINNIPSEADLSLILAVAATSFTIAAIMLWLSSRYFVLAIFTGFYLALLLLFNSGHWVWELGEAFPVKPVAAIIKQSTPSQQKIYTSYPQFRPSLEFYSDRVIIPTSDQELTKYWQQKSPVYLLVEPSAIARLSLEPHKTLGNSVAWQLITQGN